MVANGSRTAVGLLMPPGAPPCSPASLDIFDRTLNIRSMLCGLGSLASRNGTVTNGGNDFRPMQIVAVPRVNGLPTIYSAVAGGSGSFPCAAATLVPESFTTVG